MLSATKKIATLRVHGPDCKGIVAACSSLLDRFGCGIVKSEQWTDRKADMFFQRIAFYYGNMNTDKQSAGREIQETLHDFRQTSQLNWRDRRKRVAVMVSKSSHCLWELLLRHEAKELVCDIPLVISNHADLKPVADTFHIPFKIYPMTDSLARKDAERQELELLADNDIDVVVLARYMQVMSSHFLSQYPDRIINIHHSFLPAFSGGKAYHQAHERGVKLIGATAHYATADLDEGPIIEQDVITVSHRNEVGDFIRKGRILERNVLVRALQAHLDDRVIVYNNKCVVFGD